jgi:hypothetical protein
MWENLSIAIFANTINISAKNTNISYILEETTECEYHHRRMLPEHHAQQLVPQCYGQGNVSQPYPVDIHI